MGSCSIPEPPLEFRQDPQSQPTTVPTAEAKRRLYTLWPGANRFFCFGRCITGPRRDIKYTILMWSCILGCSLAYCALAVPILWFKVSVIFPCFSVILLLLSILFFLLTTCSDPGIIPRAEVFQLFGSVPGQFVEQPEGRRNDRVWCSTCHILRPPRASHCA